MYFSKSDEKNRLNEGKSDSTNRDSRLKRRIFLRLFKVVEKREKIEKELERVEKNKNHKGTNKKTTCLWSFEFKFQNLFEIP